jgi:hypothetical protein
MTDGAVETVSTTLTINRRSVQIAPQNRTAAFHTLGGNPLEVTLANIGLPSLPAGVALTLDDFDIFFYEGTEAVGTGSTVPPSLPGIYTVIFSLNEEMQRNFVISNAGGVGRATYTVTARTGLIQLPPDIREIYTGRPVVVTVATQEFHLNPAITYEGAGGTEYALSSEPPYAIGDYRVVFTCVTDTVLETYTAVLRIRGREINAGIAATAIYNVNGNSANLLPSLSGAAANNWLEYTFTHTLDGSQIVKRINGASLPNIPFRPGIYTYTTRTEGFVVTTGGTGSITVLLDNTLRAFEFANNYFNTADSWYTTYCAHTRASAPLGISGETWTYTRRYMNYAGDTANFFNYYSVNAGANVSGNNTRYGLQAHIPAGFNFNSNQFFYRRGNEGVISTSNPLPSANINAFTGNFTGPVTTAVYRTRHGVVPTGMLGYVVNQNTISGGIGALSLNANNQYMFTFTFRESAMEHMRNQIAIAGGHAFRNFYSLTIQFTLDINGRLMSTFLTDSYNVGTAITSTDIHHVGRELFFYNNVGYPTADNYVNPRP